MDVAHSSSKGGIARRCTRPIAGGAQNKHYARLELTIPNQSFQYRTTALRASPSPGPITHRQREQPGHANARCRLCELQVCRPGRADEQLEGDGWLGVAALAVCASGNDQDVQPERPMAADAGVLAGPAQQRVGAVLVHGAQAGARVERLRPGGVGMPELDRAIAEFQCVGVGAGLDVDAPGGEHAAGDHRVVGRLRGGHELETLDAQSPDRAACGAAAAATMPDRAIARRPARSLPRPAGGGGLCAWPTPLKPMIPGPRGAGTRTALGKYKTDGLPACEQAGPCNRGAPGQTGGTISPCWAMSVTAAPLAWRGGGQPRYW